jgi:hypothetical protein
LWIAENVLTYASPGCVEWAEALEAEIDVIGGDWAALWWALGSLRVLLVYRERPWRTIAEVEEAAENNADAWRSGRIWRGVSPLIWFWRPVSVYYLNAHTPLQRMGCVLDALGWLMMAGTSFSFWMRKVNVPEPDDEAGLVEFLKANLRFGAAPRLWWGTLSVASICAGMLLESKGGVRVHPVMASLSVALPAFAGAWSSYLVRANRRRLQQIDEVMARRGRAERRD